MGFVDYIRKTEGKDYSGRKNGLDRKCPAVLVLLGSFSGEETEALKRGLSRYISLENAVFWMSSRQISQDIFCLSAEDGPVWSVEAYHSLRQKGPEEDVKEALCRFAAGVYNAALRENFRDIGCLRLNFFIKPDEADAGLLHPLWKFFQKELGRYFDIQIQTDLYLVTDQSAFARKAPERQASSFLTLQEADGMIRRGEASLAYILSNMDSRGRICSPGEPYEAAALLMVAKCGLPERTDGASLYDDRDFGNAIANVGAAVGLEPGAFCSVGSISLDVHEQLMVLAVCRSVWNRLCRVRENLDTERIREDFGAGEKDLDNLARKGLERLRYGETEWQSTLRSRNQMEEKLLNLTQGEAVEVFYGRNLDLYLELNGTGMTEIQDQIREWARGLEERIEQQSFSHRLTAVETEMVLQKLEESLQACLEETEKLCQGARTKLEKWKETKCRGLSRQKVPYTKESVTLFQLAVGYLRLLWEEKNVQARRLRQKEMRAAVRTIRDKYGRCRRMAQTAVGELTGHIRDILEENAQRQEKLLSVVNVDDYYSRITEEMLENSRKFQELSFHLLKLAGEGKVKEQEPETVYEPVLRFCREELLGNPVFHQEFLTEIFKRLKGWRRPDGVELKKEEDISDFILQNIEDCRRYFYRGTASLEQIHEEMCFFLDTDSPLVKTGGSSIAAKLIWNNRLKLFCETQSRELRILYLAGNIRMETLHQFDSYKRAWEIWQSRTERQEEVAPDENAD